MEKYIVGVKKDGAEVKTLEADGADEIVVSINIGLVDVVFRKGNSLAEPTAPPSRQTGRGLCPRSPRVCRPPYRSSVRANDTLKST